MNGSSQVQNGELLSPDPSLADPSIALSSSNIMSHASLDTIEPAGPDRVLNSNLGNVGSPGSSNSSGIHSGGSNSAVGTSDSRNGGGGLSFFTSDRHAAVRIRGAGDDGGGFGGGVAPVSLPTVVKRSCDAAFDLPAMRVKRDGEWQTWTYGRYYHDIKAAAKAFIKFGLEPSNAVCIQSFNCPEWFIADIAAIFAGGLACGLYKTNSDETTKFVLKDACANVAVMEDADLVRRVLSMKKELPELKKIVQISGEVQTSDPDVISWSELIEFGEDVPDSLQLVDRLQNIAVNKACTLVYTSGTTGNPKGVMLSHDNIAYNVVAGLGDFGNVRANEEVFISYLPLNHIAAQFLDLWICMFSQGCVYFADPNALKGSLVETLKEARPTRFMGVPRVYEKMMEGLRAKAAETTGLKKRIGRACTNAGVNFHLNGRDSLLYRWADGLLYRRVKEALGLDRCVTFMTGAAPMSYETARYFAGFDMRLLDAYGLSETGVCLMNTDGRNRLGSVGYPLTGYKFKLRKRDDGGNTENGNAGNGVGSVKDVMPGEEGELLVSSRSVMMGYLNNPVKTAEVADESEGWMATGDLATMDDEGFFYITGRVKELIITSGGENIAPVPIEERIKAALPCLSNAVVVGDRRKYLVAFLTFKTLPDAAQPDRPSNNLAPLAMEWCRSIGSKAETVEDVIKVGDESVFFAIQEAIDQCNDQSVSRPAKVQKWTLLPKDLSIPGGELGPTLKLKRFFFNEKYEAAIDKMYEDENGNKG